MSVRERSKPEPIPEPELESAAETPPEAVSAERASLAEAVATPLIEPPGMSGESEEVEEPKPEAESIDTRAQYEKLSWSEFDEIERHYSTLKKINSQGTQKIEDQWEQDRQRLTGIELLKAKYSYLSEQASYWKGLSEEINLDLYQLTIKYLGHPLITSDKIRTLFQQYYNEDLAKLAKNNNYQKEEKLLDKLQRGRLKIAQDFTRKTYKIQKKLDKEWESATEAIASEPEPTPVEPEPQPELATRPDPRYPFEESAPQ